jgi:hypothetical protein
LGCARCDPCDDHEGLDCLQERHSLSKLEIPSDCVCDARLVAFTTARDFSYGERRVFHISASFVNYSRYCCSCCCSCRFRSNARLFHVMTWAKVKERLYGSFTSMLLLLIRDRDRRGCQL